MSPISLFLCPVPFHVPRGTYAPTSNRNWSITNCCDKLRPTHSPHLITVCQRPLDISHVSCFSYLGAPSSTALFLSITQHGTTSQTVSIYPSKQGVTIQIRIIRICIIYTSYTLYTRWPDLVHKGQYSIEYT